MKKTLDILASFTDAELEALEERQKLEEQQKLEVLGKRQELEALEERQEQGALEKRQELETLEKRPHLENLEDPEILNTKDSDPGSKKLYAFLKQLSADCKKDIAGGHDANKFADSWLATLRKVATEKPTLFSENSLNKIDALYTSLNSQGPFAITLLEMYQAINTIKHEIEANKIKGAVSEYRTFLGEQINKKNTIKNDEKSRLNEKNTPALQQKLQARYDAINTLHEQINTKATLDTSDIARATEALKTCLNNEPTWNEKPFLKKLADVLSLGTTFLFKAVYKAVVLPVTETKLQKDLEQSLPESHKLNH